MFVTSADGRVTRYVFEFKFIAFSDVGIVNSSCRIFVMYIHGNLFFLRIISLNLFDIQL